MSHQTCRKLRDHFESRGDTAPIPDELALHLDRCQDCRRSFDAARVELDPASFERLEPARREAIFAAVARLRAGKARWRFAAAAAALVALVVLAIMGSLRLVGEGRSAVAEALVEDHIRYLHEPETRASPSPDSALADLRSYLDFPLQVREPQDARLTGARRCYLLSRRVALLFYDPTDTAAGDPVSYFVLDGTGLDSPGVRCGPAGRLRCAERDGFRVVSWRRIGLLHAVVGPEDSAISLADELAEPAANP